MPESKISFKLFDAVTLAAERTSGVVSLGDAAAFALAYNFGGVGAATDLFFEVDFYPTKYDADNQTAAVKFPLLGGQVALDGTNAVETLEPFQAKRTASSADLGVFSIPSLMPYARVRMDGTSGDASDIVTVYCTLVKE